MGSIVHSTREIMQMKNSQAFWLGFEAGTYSLIDKRNKGNLNI